MTKVLENVTIETFPEAVRQGKIQPGQRFAIVLEGARPLQRPKLAEIAARMRATAAARGLTREVFDGILVKN